jgi:preprotein translocase subunit YajC
MSMRSSNPGDILSSLMPIGLIFVVFYIFLIRPQQKKAKKHGEMISSISVGDVIVNSSGMILKVVKLLNDKEIEVQLSEGVNVKMFRSAISDVISSKNDISSKNNNTTKTSGISSNNSNNKPVEKSDSNSKPTVKSSSTNSNFKKPSKNNGTFNNNQNKSAKDQSQQSGSAQPSSSIQPSGNTQPSGGISKDDIKSGATEAKPKNFNKKQ